MPRIVLEAERVRVRIASEPSGADAVLVRKGERRELGRTPVDVTLDNDGSRWSLEVSKSGYESYSHALALADGAAELNVRAVLKGEGEAEEPAAEPVAAAEPKRRESTRSESSESRRASEPSASSERPARAAEPPPRARAAAARATLRINTRPWSQVTIDGRAIGNTPQMNIPLDRGQPSRDARESRGSTCART